MALLPALPSARDQTSSVRRLARLLYPARLCPVLIAISLGWSVVSSVSIIPHQLAYFNELSGGSENGHKHLLGSNLDWGQDFLFARDWLREHGISPEEVRIISYGRLAKFGPQVIDVPGESSSPRFEIVSFNRIVAADGAWRDSALSGSAHRIGYTMSIFPVE